MLSRGWDEAQNGTKQEAELDVKQWFEGATIDGRRQYLRSIHLSLMYLSFAMTPV